MIQNTGKLAGRTVFITGASRGIGKAIALKVAKDGANVVIAAKTAEANPKLPGTIYTAAEEVEAAGGKCLPCIVDIREEDQVKRAVEAAVQKFGGIDILVNNASAISLTGTLETPMKRYDLMHSINTRGTYLTTKYCIPYLKIGRNPHVLNLSPPLNLNPYWFKSNVAYTMAKYGMSMCVLGMAEEFKDEGVAFNALWPRTSIATAAVNMLGGKDMMDASRKVDIISDAAYVILCKDSRSYTGNFAIDDTVLREAGVSNFDSYAVNPGHHLQPDFFLDEAIPGASGERPPESKAAPPAEGAPTVQAIFAQLQKSMTPELVKEVGVMYKFNITGDDAGEWFINLRDAQGEVTQKSGDSKIDLEITVGGKDLVNLFQGKLKPAAAYMSGKLKIKGDLAKAMKLEKVFSRYKAKL